MTYLIQNIPEDTKEFLKKEQKIFQSLEDPKKPGEIKEDTGFRGRIVRKCIQDLLNKKRIEITSGRKFVQAGRVAQSGRALDS